MSKFMEYLRAQLGSIYVWGAQGQNVLAQPNPEAWIRGMETSTENAVRAINLFNQRKMEGVYPILAYDCSGLVVNFLLENGIIKSDRTAQMLYDLCDVKLGQPEQAGDFCFRYDPDKKRIIHIGVYTGDGLVIEAKGRDYGVVETGLATYPWNRFGRLTALAPYLTDYPDSPMPLDVVKPVHEGEGYAKLQEALNSLGYTDDKGAYLEVDGKWGKKSRQAWDKAVAASAAPAERHTVIVEIDGHIVSETEIEF